MDKEKLFQEYAITYMDYLKGSSSRHDTYRIIEKINSAISEEANNEEEIEGIVKANNKRIDEIQDVVRTKYNEEIARPLTKELLDLLQFEGMVRDVQFKKRAEELKEKLQKYDGLFIIRERALDKFFTTKIGSRYDEYDKLGLILRVGGLDTKNL